MCGWARRGRQQSEFRVGMVLIYRFVNRREGFINHGLTNMDVAEFGDHTNSKFETAQVQYIPLRQWCIEERALGQTTAQAITSFNAAVRDSRAKTMKAGNVHLIGVFRGIMVENENGKESEVAINRKRKIDDVHDLQSAMNRVNDVHGNFTNECVSAMDDMLDKVHTENGDVPVEEEQCDNMGATIDSGLGSELISDTRKGLKEQEVEDSTRRDMEEDDDHQACEALRLKRLSCKKVGRPKKSRIAILGGITGTLADKKTTINDKIEQVKVNVAEVLAECALEMEKALGSAELPADVNDMERELKKEEKRIIDALGEVIAQISATTAEEFETEMQDKTSTDLKKALGEQITDVSPLMTECTKAIGISRRAYKKISGCANKKSKKNVVADPILGAQEMVQHGIRRGRTVPTLKAGVRVVADKPADFIWSLTSECKPSFYNMPKEIITKCETAGFKAHAKWLKKHCKENSLTTANSQIRPMVSKQKYEHRREGFPRLQVFPAHDDGGPEGFGNCSLWLQDVPRPGLALLDHASAIRSS